MAVLSDFNECNLNNAGCEHVCNNTGGSFDCDCRAGYKLKSDSRGCEGRVLSFPSQRFLLYRAKNLKYSPLLTASLANPISDDVHLFKVALVTVFVRLRALNKKNLKKMRAR